MTQILLDRFKLYENFELINDDVLKVDLEQIINKNLFMIFFVKNNNKVIMYNKNKSEIKLLKEKRESEKLKGYKISSKIKFTANIDLNALFNLNYNFDLLKGIIDELLKNQQILQDQMDMINEKDHAKDERIEKEQIYN